jgi:hypothetical protein
MSSLFDYVETTRQECRTCGAWVRLCHANYSLIGDDDVLRQEVEDWVNAYNLLAADALANHNCEEDPDCQIIV